MRFTPRLVGTALATAAFAPAIALAQTTSGPVITQSQAFYPNRVVNGESLGTSTRPQNLNPFGINYSDCAQDMRLDFTISIANWTAGDTLQVWVTNENDCTGTATRGNGSVPTCWEVASDASLVGSTGSSFTKTYSVMVRDIVGPQGRVPNPTGLSQTQAVGEADGINSCKQQTTFLSVPMYVWFMAINPNGSVDGTPFQYGAPSSTTTTTAGTTGTFNTDLVGPPAPTITPIQAGDTLLFVNWTPNVDADTTGYDVMIDPIPGTEGSATDSGANGPDATTLICPAAEASTSGTDATDESTAVVDATDESASTGDGSDEASASSSSSGGSSSSSSGSSSGSSSSSSSGSTPVGCVNGGAVPPPNPNNTCNDPTLTSATLIGTAGQVTVTEDASTSTDEASTTDEAGTIVDDDASTTSATEGSFGLSTIPLKYIIGYNASTQLTVPDIQTGTFTVSGLQNGVTYTVVVAAVDTSGNIGPPSAEQCDSPAPVDDFWKIYSTDGGRAGGGFCALEAVGRPAPLGFGVGALGVAGVIAMRRRRNRRRS